MVHRTSDYIVINGEALTNPNLTVAEKFTYGVFQSKGCYWDVESDTLKTKEDYLDILVKYCGVSKQTIKKRLKRLYDFNLVDIVEEE